MIKNKMVLSVSYIGLERELLNEITRLASQLTSVIPIRTDNFTTYYVNIALQKIIDYGYGKFLYRSRAWRNIDPVIYEAIRDNAKFLDIDIAYADRINYYENETHYFWSKDIGEPLSHCTLEDDLLAEIHHQCPYLFIDKYVEEFVIETIYSLVEVFIPEYFLKQGSSYSLLNQFQDHYLEVYKNQRHGHFIIVINKYMTNYIQLLAERELEMDHRVTTPRYYGSVQQTDTNTYQDYAAYG